MAKRAKTEKVMTCKRLKTQIQKTKQMFLRRFQQVVKESCDKSDDSDSFLLCTRNISEKSSSKRDSAAFRATVGNEDTTRDNYTCYRCQHFLEIPHNLSRPFSNRVSTFIDERCKAELSFVQAIVWLKSAIVCVSQIPVEQLQQIFDQQWNTCGGRHREVECTNVERLTSPVTKDLLVSERTSMRDTLAISTPLEYTSNIPFTPQRTILYAKSKDIQNKPLSFASTNDLNQSSVESLILESSNSCHIVTKEKQKEIESSIIAETDAESILSEDLHVYNSIPEHQCFEFEKDIGCSVQNALKNGIQQINKKIIENKHLQENHTDVTSKRKSILSARNQSIDPMFDLENNFSGECFTSIRSQNNLSDKVLKSNSSPKSFIITPKDVSQISNINNDEYFKILFDDNSPWQMNNSAARNVHEDSAYSTSRNDIFNYDTAVETESIVSNNKRLLDTEHCYKFEPCKKKTIIYVTEKISSIDGMSDSSPKSLIITQKEISQISDVYDNENSEFQVVSGEQTSDTIFENLEDDAGADVVTESIDDKCTPNIEHSYELYSCNEETITREKMTASTSIIENLQGVVISDANIKHRYNLRARNNRRMNGEKEASSTTIERPKERRSKQVRNLLKKENENEDKMISADWLNFTLKSLRIECLIMKSIKVILTTFCDEKTAEEYVIKERRRNMRNYWKGSLEEEAINAVLNMSDIFITEKKPNICINVIMTAIIRTLNEMTMLAQPNKIYHTETSTWIYRVQIILEFCNSLPICVKVINYLLTRLKLLQSVLINAKNIQKNTYIVINQLHLVFYGLNIALRKYRTIIPNDQRSRSAEKLIPHVADLWKIPYIDKELESTDLDLNAAEKQWLNALENSGIAFTKHFVQFAEKSFSLVHVLISQSSTRIT